MDYKVLSPFNGRKTQLEEKVDNVEALPTYKKDVNLFKLFKVAAKVMGQHSTNYIYDDRNNVFEEPEYNFEQIMQAVDTDSYCQQAFAKYQELLWKSGWEIEGENEEAVTYLKGRIALMEVTMQRSFTSLLKEVSDHFVKFHNVFIVKHRADISSYLTNGGINSYTNKNPIIGYYLIPPETVSIRRTKNNRPTRYKQKIDSGMGFGSSTNDPEWPAEEVIHIFLNRKTGRLYGTPFLISVLDDVISLRQMEQDLLNLSHRELFPIFKYMLTDLDQDGPDAETISQIIDQLEEMRTEGSMLLPPGHDINVVGSEGSVLDVTPYLNHFKERVASGLGLFPHHLGMVSSAGGNRDMTDRLDQALYDRIKYYQRELEDSFTFHIINELLLDGGYDPFSGLSGRQSDQCFFKFKEIDQDSRIKIEAHEVYKYVSGIVDRDEVRLAVGLLPELIDEDKTAEAIAAKIADQYAQPAVGASPAPKSPTGQKSSTGGKPNSKNRTKGASNIVKPQNQQGTRTSPNIRQDHSMSLVSELDKEAFDLVELYLDELKDE